MDFNIYFLISETDSKYEIVGINKLHQFNFIRYLTMCEIDSRAEITQIEFPVKRANKSYISYCSGVYIVDKIIVKKTYDLLDINTYKMLIKLGVDNIFLINHVVKLKHWFLIKYFIAMDNNQYLGILRYASKYGYLDIIKYIIKLKLRPDYIYKEILINSIAYNHKLIFEYIIKQYQFDDNNQAIKIAISNDCLSMLKYLIEKYPPDDYYSIVRIAYNNLDCLKFLTEINTNIMEIILSYGQRECIISSAVSVGNLSVVKFIIESVVLTNDDSDKIETLIIKAFKNGHLDMVEYLILQLEDIGSNQLFNPNYRHLDLIIMDAIKNGRLNVLKYIINKQNYVCEYIKINISKIIKSLLSCGHLNIIEYIDKNLFPIDNSMIEANIGYEHFPIIKYFFGRINDKNKTFKIGIVHHNYFITKFFKDNGLDIKFTNEQFTASIYSSNYLMIKYMIDNGYDPNIKCSINSLMKHAINNNRLLIVKYLKNEESFFKYSVDNRNNNLSMIKLMIKLENIDVNGLNYILQVGSQRNQLHLVKFALRKGADIDCQKIEIF